MWRRNNDPRYSFVPPLNNSKKYKLTESEIIDGIKSGTIFGLAEVDIHTPDHLKERFKEMTPVFKHCQNICPNLA